MGSGRERRAQRPAFTPPHMPARSGGPWGHFTQYLWLRSSPVHELDTRQHQPFALWARHHTVVARQVPYTAALQRAKRVAGVRKRGWGGGIEGLAIGCRRRHWAGRQGGEGVVAGQNGGKPGGSEGRVGCRSRAGERGPAGQARAGRERVGGWAQWLWQAQWEKGVGELQERGSPEEGVRQGRLGRGAPTPC